MRTRLTIIAGLATLLSSLGLYPLFDGTGWVWSGFGAIISVAGGSLLVRRFRLATIFNLAGALAALLLYLTVRYASAEAFLGIIPTPSSLARLVERMGDGWREANRYAAPVPLERGIELLATLGIGLVAALVDLLAVRLRRAAPAGLPLLALYSVPAAIREESVSWAAFAAGAVGFLALLLADAREQVGGWGRPVFTHRWSEAAPRERPDSSALAATGRRIGLAAVAVAVAVPTVVPGIEPRGLFGMGGVGGGAGGSQTVTTPEPMVSLKRELTRQGHETVLTYRTDDPSPDYLRLYALDRFDGDRWTYSQLSSSSRDRVADRILPAPPGLESVPAPAVTTRIKIERKVRKLTFLPAPYAPSRVSIKGDWRVHGPSLMLYSLRDAAGGRSYTVTSLQAQPSGSQLSVAITPPQSIVVPYTRVPEEVSADIRQLANQVVGYRTRTQYDQAMKLQRWFTQGHRFAYDTGAPAPKHTSDLVDFLMVSRRGYCEQFAASMALMARIVGIPARVAMGYTAGAKDKDGKWVVKSRDAHAWPELYFQGAGWVRFEPTPSGGEGQGTATIPVYAQTSTPGSRSTPDGRDSPSAQPSTDPSQGTAPGALRGQRPDVVDSGLGPDQSADSGGGLPLGWIAGVTLVLLLLVTPMLARLLARRRRWARALPSPQAPRTPGRGGRRSPWGGAESTPAGAVGAAHAAWREMRADAIDHGLTWRASDSPRAAAQRLSELLELSPPASEALSRIAKAEERARYSRAPASVDTLRDDVRLVREAFAGSVDRRTRWRARLAPPSTMESFRNTGSRLLDAFDRLDSLGTALRRHLPKRRP